MGSCSCDDEYSGDACECVPGCHAETAPCSNAGDCDCTTGGCACSPGFFGVECQDSGLPTYTTLVLDDDALENENVALKEYRFYRLQLNASTFDVTVLLQSPDSNFDPDLYASFEDPFPTSLTEKSISYTSNRATSDDAIHLCGSYGTFPRGINDTLRSCVSADSNYVNNAPGWLYIAVFGYSAATYRIHVHGDLCQSVSCTDHGICGRVRFRFVKWY